MNNMFKISGLDCANCARELEEEIKKLKGVQSASVDFMAQKVIVDCDAETLVSVKDICNNFEEVKVVESGADGGEKIKICGLCCANCARELEEELNNLQGVEASVDFVNLNITLNTDNAESRDKAIYAITHFEDVKIVEEKPYSRKRVIKEHLKDIVLIAVSLAFFIPAFVLDLTGLFKTNFAAQIICYVFFSVAYIAVGYKVLLNTAKNILKGKIFDENFLMTIASVGAILLGIFAEDGFAEGVAVMLLYQIGEVLQGIAVGASRNSISSLMELKSESANLSVNGEIRVVRPEDLRIGNKILIKNGEKVPVDCKIVKGETFLDMKSLNGESLLREVKEGDELLSGSINVSKVIEAEVIREYSDSAIAKILELVENSTAKKAKSEKFITKFAKYYTPVVCIVAAIVAGLIPTIICAVQNSFVWETYREWLYTALNFLVISCPCALVISVPLSYFGGIGRAAKFGILVKGSTCLDEFALAKVAAFDKTGTLTEGKFGITEYTNEKTLALAAAAEKFSSHPIAEAFKNVNTDYEVSEAEEISGKGVKCMLGEKILLCGSGRLLAENGVKFESVKKVSTLVYVALDGEYIGFIAVDDIIKKDAAEALKRLKNMGIERTVMLTGDLKERAETVASACGLDGFEAELLPDMKLEKAEELKKYGKLLYAGDGINDAPVMTAADCAVSMGKVGSDAAIEASDVVLVTDDLSLLPLGRKIAKKTRGIVKQNIVISLVVKVAIMALSVSLINFPLIISVIADVGVMLLAVLNAMRTQLINSRK